jgi:hypothetical protein
VCFATADCKPVVFEIKSRWGPVMALASGRSPSPGLTVFYELLRNGERM